MSDISVDADAFGMTLSKILERLGRGVEEGTPEAVTKTLELGESAWKRNAKAVLSSSYSRGGWGKIKSQQTYSRGPRKGQVKKTTWYGKTYKTGPYARSISHRMTSGGLLPEGEIGSTSLPGLAHLLEKGHGGTGAAPAKPHIADAFDEAERFFEMQIDQVIEKALNDA